MSNFIKPKAQEVALNQAKVILKGAGLNYVKAKFFVIDNVTAANEQVGLDDYDKKSIYGTPIFDIVSFDAFSYVDENGNTVNCSKFDLDIALVDVNKPRNIITTKIAGRNGTIKEYMSDDDYQITIRGSFTNKLAYASPEDLIRAFDAITKAPQELKITSNFLAFFNIYSVVIMNSTCKQREGERNIIDYELSCISDTPFEIQNSTENNNTNTGSRPMF